jgi:SAM-dependent methyltransferase
MFFVAAACALVVVVLLRFLDVERHRQSVITWTQQRSHGMPPLNADAYGRLIYSHHKGRPSAEIIERDDHWFDVSAGAPAYFAPFEKWPSVERRAIRHVRGRVLDVGCGAGRVALYLQSRGHEVVAIDISPLAVKTCRLRGVRDARACSITRIGRQLGRFDTVVMFGNNFGLFGNPGRARRLLRRLHGMTSAAARVVAESRNPYKAASADHRRYHQLNRRRGRLAGQLRLRVRYVRSRTPGSTTCSFRLAKCVRSLEGPDGA